MPKYEDTAEDKWEALFDHLEANDLFDTVIADMRASLKRPHLPKVRDAIERAIAKLDEQARNRN